MSNNFVKFLLSEPQEIQNILLYHKTQQCQYKRKQSESDSDKGKNKTENTEQKHVEEQCPNYHSENDKRRSPYVENFENLTDNQTSIFAYSSKQCEEYQCNDFQSCQDCNNISEHKFHPLNYKTGKMCKNASNCQFQNRLFCPDLHENETPRVLPNRKKMSDQSQISDKSQQQDQITEKKENLTENIQNSHENNPKQIQIQQNEIDLTPNHFQMFTKQNQTANKSPEQNSQPNNGVYFPFQLQNQNNQALNQNQNFMPQVNKIGGNFEQQQQNQQQQPDSQQFQPQQEFMQNQFNLKNMQLNQQRQQLQQQQQMQLQQQQCFNPTNNGINQQTKMLQQQQAQKQKAQKQQNQQKMTSMLGLGRPKSLRQTPFVDLDTFKTEACQSHEPNHNPKNCVYYHNNCDRRRSPKDYTYSFNICPNRCLKDECPYSHNKVEQLYHRCRYKSKFCKSYGRDNGKCEYGIYCSFAHNDQEISIQLIHEMEHNDVFNIWYYKTVWCPYTNNHDRGQCPYAHNVQDFRRDPVCFDIEPEDCPNWTKSDNVSLYNDGGCPNLLKCNKCHGWKELEYHPKVYRTKKCTNQKNCKKKDCAYYHSEADRNTRDENYRPGFKPQKNFIFYENLETKIYQGMPLDLFKDNNIMSKQYNNKSNVLYGNNSNHIKQHYNNKHKDKNQMNPAKNIYYENNIYHNQQQHMQQPPKSYMINQMQEYQMGPMKGQWKEDSPTNTTGPNSLCPSYISHNFSRDNSNDSNQQKSHQTNQSIRTIKTNFNHFYQKGNYNSDGEIDPQQIKNNKKGINHKKMKIGSNDFYPKNCINSNTNNPLYIQPKIKNNRQIILGNNSENNGNDFFQDITVDNINLNNNMKNNQKKQQFQKNDANTNSQVNSYFYNKSIPKRALSPEENLINNQNGFDQQQFSADFFQMMGSNNSDFNQQNMFNNNFNNFGYTQNNNKNSNNNSNFNNNNDVMNMNFCNQGNLEQDCAQDFNNFSNFNQYFQNMNIKDDCQFYPGDNNFQQGNLNTLNFNNNNNFHKNSENFSNNGLQGQNFHSDDESSYFQPNNNNGTNFNNNNIFDSQNQNHPFTQFQQRENMYNNNNIK